MKVSCTQLSGLISLVITMLALLVSIVSPYWVVNPLSNHHYGIVENCNKKCKWIYENDFEGHRERPDWFKATQGLMAAGLIAEVIALSVALLAACCKCYSINPHRLTSGFLLLSFISTLVGIVVFCVSANEKWDVKLNNELGENLGWALWIGVGSTGMVFVTSVIFTCASRDKPEDYQAHAQAYALTRVRIHRSKNRKSKYAKNA